MRYTTKSLEINVVISGKVLLFNDIKIVWGFYLLHEKWTLYFGKITTSRCQQLQIIE